MNKLFKTTILVLAMALSVISCRETTSEETMDTENNGVENNAEAEGHENADVKIKIEEDGDVKKKIETENKEVKVKIEEDGDKKKKVDYDN